MPLGVTNSQGTSLVAFQVTAGPPARSMSTLPFSSKSRVSESIDANDIRRPDESRAHRQRDEDLLERAERILDSLWQRIARDPDVRGVRAGREIRAVRREARSRLPPA